MSPFLLVRLLLACLVVAGGLGAQTPLTLQLKWKHQWQFAGYYAALEQGYYRRAGLAVQIKEAVPGQSSVETVLRGQAAFGITTSDLVLHRAQGRPVVSLAVIFQHSPLVFLARSDRGILSIHDLVGKRVGFEANAEELWAYLKAEGLSAQSLQARTKAFDSEAFLKGQWDAMTAYSTDEPYGLEQAGVDYAMFTPRSAGIDFYGDTLFTSETFLKRQPRVVEAFVNASLEGWKYALEHPDDVVELLVQKYHSSHGRDHLRFEAERSRRLILPELVALGYQHEGRWRHIAQTYQNLGLIQELPDLSSFLYQAQPRRDWRAFYVAGGALLLFLAAGGAAFHLARLNRTLKQALADVKTLSGLIPICASCKKVRDDHGYWTQVEGYVQAHSQATFTHGLCPECREVYFPKPGSGSTS